MATGEMCKKTQDQAALIVWDFDRMQMMFRVKIHMHHVQSLAFNCDDTYMISIGGHHDQSRLVLWNLKEGKSEAAQPLSDIGNSETTDVKFYHKEPTKFITGHNNGLKFQMLDKSTLRF